jgi:hypothetical protein
LSGGILTGGTQRIQQDGDLVNIKDITATGAFTTTGVGPHGIGTTGSTNIQLLIDGAFTAIGGSSASGIRYNSDITGVSGNTVRLTHFDMGSPTITTQSVDETVDDIASFRIVRPNITNNLFNAGLGVAITSATNGTVTTTGAHGFSTSDIVHINGNTDSNHNGWWTITNTGSNTFTLNEYTGTSSGTGGDAYPASKITKAATLWIPNEPTAGTATGIDEAWGIYAPVSARLGNVTAGLIEPISDSTYALGTAINRWSTVYADSLDVGTFLAGDGAESAPSYAFSDDSNTGMWSPVNDTIAFSTGGTERFRVASGAVSSYEAFFVIRPTGNSVIARFRREDNTDLAWDQRIDPGGTYEIRSITDTGITVLNALQLEHATGDLTLKGWIRSEDGSAGSPTYSFSNDADTGMSVSAGSYIRFSVNSADTFRVYNGSVRSLGGSPAYHWYENDAAFNEKHWRIIASGGSLFFQGREDDGEVFANPTYLRFYRSGTTISYTETFGQWRYADGSAANPAVSFSDNTSIGMYRSGDDLALTADASLRLQVAGSDHLIAGSAAGGSTWVYVPGVLRVGNELRLADGAVGDPSLAFTSQETTGLYYTSSQINWAIAGTRQMYLNSAGLSIEDPTQATLWFYENDAAANEGNYRITASGGDLYFQAFNDAASVFSTGLRFINNGSGGISSIYCHATFRPDSDASASLGANTVRWDTLYVDTAVLTNALAVNYGGIGLSAAIANDQLLVSTGSGYEGSGNLTYNASTGLDLASGVYSGNGSGLTGVVSDSSTVTDLTTQTATYYPIMADGTSGAISHFVDASELSYTSSTDTLNVVSLAASSDVTMGTNADLVFSGGSTSVLTHTNQSTRDKIRVWNSSLYTIGMQNSFTFGPLVTDYAMTPRMAT